MAVPLVIAAAWEQPELRDLPGGRQRAREEKSIPRFFYLFFPLLILVMSLRIAHVRLGLAATVISSLVCGFEHQIARDSASSGQGAGCSAVGSHA